MYMVWSMKEFVVQDAGQYKCRVDYHLQQTSFQLLDLSVIVPPSAPIILHNNQPGTSLGKIYVCLHCKPFDEKYWSHLIKYLIISNWFWLIGSNIYILTGTLSVKSNKIHVKENQSLTLTCESEGTEVVSLEIGKWFQRSIESWARNQVGR